MMGDLLDLAYMLFPGKPSPPSRLRAGLFWAALLMAMFGAAGVYSAYIFGWKSWFTVSCSALAVLAAIWLVIAVVLMVRRWRDPPPADLGISFSLAIFFTLLLCCLTAVIVMVLGWRGALLPIGLTSLAVVWLVIASVGVVRRRRKHHKTRKS